VIIVMEKGASKEVIDNVLRVVQAKGLGVHLSAGVEKTIIGVIGVKDRIEGLAFEALDGVEKVIAVLKPYKLASREYQQDDTIITVGDVTIGGNALQVIAGPCAVESRDGLLEIADIVQESGARFLRGGAFKPRSSPYSFQGLGEKGLEILAEARERTGLRVISEVVDTRSVHLVSQYVDILQVGSRNMQNFALLHEVGKQSKPVMLKRSMSATIEEWIMAAEYILAAGNKQVILCERGIKTFETYTRNTLDLASVAAVKNLSHLPVIVDPSHATGRWKLVAPMAAAAVIAGADGVMVEVHPQPSEALSDGPQSLKPQKFMELMDSLKHMAAQTGRVLGG
jgi:3-deoxy-7-phosphoheptulonate synthase